MTPEFTKVNAAFVKIADKQKLHGPESSTAAEKAILHVWHSLGLIQCEGLHGYLFIIDDIYPIDKILDELFDLQLSDVALAINDGAQLLLAFLLNNPGVDPPDLDAFRKANNAELNRLEKIIYSSESQITQALLRLVEGEPFPLV